MAGVAGNTKKKCDPKKPKIDKCHHFFLVVLIPSYKMIHFKETWDSLPSHTKREKDTKIS